MKFTELAHDADTWDQDTGMPSVAHFGNAVQVWSMAQDHDHVSIEETAEAFNVAPALIREAVEAHPWMFLDGDDIGHDGE